MRPAADVVSRILWDSSLDPSDFAVGYLDRFLGVLERPFSEFSWDRDVCNCDFAEELALPQHRIKYFTYKGKRIWDRESRMDGVFGSTGGTLELPLCAEEGVGEVGTRCITSYAKEKKPMHYFFKQGSVSTDEVLTKLGSLEQRSKSSRYKPTHFITFRTDSPAFVASFHCLQKELTAILPHSAPYWVSPETLHVTLCLLILPGPKEVNLACEALRDFARKHHPRLFSLSCSSKPGHFWGRVLYLTPEPLLQIQSLNHHFQNLYKKNGWLHRDSLSPTFHLTLAKVKGKGGGSPFKGVEDIWRDKKMSAIDFGKLVVNKLYLCVNDSSRREDGFYETVCTISLE
ncbi:leukocyte receptor cluster member 9-like [Scleropages formosus]|uniref:Leukocyte receptor cluster member 9-like n=1 Tax=Scleropages formosus TaxID=113540 RepID=A0A0P7VM33_SCLFO|nr:leukocyte receptor cluster member 9-like [Scleropages formosus]